MFTPGLKKPSLLIFALGIWVLLSPHDAIAIPSPMCTDKGKQKGNIRHTQATINRPVKWQAPGHARRLCLRTKRSKRHRAQRRKARQTATNKGDGIQKGLLIALPNLKKRRIGNIRTLWGTHPVYVTNKSQNETHPFYISWAAWRLLGEPVVDSTALWWFNKPLYACIDKRIPALQNAVGSYPCALIPKAVAQKIRAIDLSLHVPVYTKDGQKKHCPSTACAFMTLNPGALSAPYMSSRLGNIHSLPQKKQARYWSFNVPGSPSWRRLFSNGAGTQFLPAAGAKQIVKAGFTLGNKIGVSALIGRSFYTPWLRAGKQLLAKSKKRISLRMAKVKKVNFDMSAVFAWFEKKVKQDSEFNVLSDALKKQMNNMEQQHKIPTSWLAGQLQALVVEYQRKPAGRQRIIRKLKGLVAKSARRLPKALVNKKNIKQYRANKRKILKKATLMLRLLRRIHATMRKKINRSQRRINIYFKRRKRKLQRRGQRGALCAACYPLISFENEKIQNGATFYWSATKFTIRGRFSSDITKYTLRMNSNQARKEGELQVTPQHHFTQTFILRKGLNQFNILFASGKRRVHLKFAIRRGKRVICIPPPNYNLEKTVDGIPTTVFSPKLFSKYVKQQRLNCLQALTHCKNCYYYLTSKNNVYINPENKKIYAYEGTSAFIPYKITKKSNVCVREVKRKIYAQKNREYMLSVLLQMRLRCAPVWRKSNYLVRSSTFRTGERNSRGKFHNYYNKYKTIGWLYNSDVFYYSPKLPPGRRPRNNSAGKPDVWVSLDGQHCNRSPKKSLCKRCPSCKRDTTMKHCYELDWICDGAKVRIRVDTFRELSGSSRYVPFRGGWKIYPYVRVTKKVAMKRHFIVVFGHSKMTSPLP